MFFFFFFYWTFLFYLNNLVFSYLRVDKQNYFFSVVFQYHDLLLVLFSFAVIEEKKTKQQQKKLLEQYPCIKLLFPACQSWQNSALLLNGGGRAPCGGQFVCLHVCVRKRDGRTETDAGRLFPGWHKLPAFLIEGGSTASEDQFSESSVHNNPPQGFL